jgi:molybdopterin-containing oxidoreductase family membrane subunit
MTRPALLGIFIYLDDLLAAIKALDGKGLDLTIYSPSAHGEIKEALRQNPSPVRYYTLFGGLFGLISGFFLAFYTVLQWKFVVSGKPVIPWIPFVIVGFEFLILFGVFISFAGMLIHSRLPRRRLPVYYDPRFSDNRFGLLVACSSQDREKLAGLLREAGAEEIHDLE